jgi:GDP-4-dehydro-6-deoxy-D-mannose reductase
MVKSKMKTRVLITGVTGFVGSHMLEYLLRRGDCEIYGLRRWQDRMDNIEHLEDKFITVEGDITDGVSMRRIMNDIQPDKIFHLAAQSFVPTSWKAPEETLITNIIGTLKIFEAVRSARINPDIQIACSSEEYGSVYPNEIPVKENNSLRPLSPYAVSKVACDVLGYQYHKSYNLRIIRTRAFNHEGPRRGEVFVTSNFAKQIAEIEKGKQKPVIYVGNLSAQRDWSDVRDIVRAYWLVLEKGKPGEVYNIASGKSRTVEEMLNILLSFSKVKIEIKQDPSRMRPSDVQILKGDCSKFKKITGWKPEFSLEQTLKDSLNYWRSKI